MFADFNEFPKRMSVDSVPLSDLAIFIGKQNYMSSGISTTLKKKHHLAKCPCLQNLNEEL